VSTTAAPEELEQAEATPVGADVDEPTGDVEEADGSDTVEASGTASPEVLDESTGELIDGDEAERRRQVVVRDEAALAQAKLEKAQKTLEALIGRRLEELYGKEAVDQLELCELCTWSHTHGWRVPQLPPEQVIEAVKRAIGIGTLDQYSDFPAFQTCQACNGMCHVKTGAKAGTELTRKCPVCNGRGYSSALAEDSGRPPAADPIVAESHTEGLPPVLPDRDMFNTPLGHPDYGKMPQFREVPIAHWQEQAAAQ